MNKHDVVENPIPTVFLNYFIQKIRRGSFFMAHLLYDLKKEKYAYQFFIERKKKLNSNPFIIL